MAMTHRMRVTGVLTAVALLAPSAAFPCSFGETTSVELALMPAATLASELLDPSDGDLGTSTAPQIRFFYPFTLVDPATFKPVMALAYANLYDTADPLPPVSTAALDAAVQAGDWAAEEKAAKAIVSAVLDQPAFGADGSQPALHRALEVLESLPVLKRLGPQGAESPEGVALEAALQEVRGISGEQATALAKEKPKHPRIATLRFVALRHRLRTGVADGFDAAEIRKATPPAVFAELLKGCDAWLREFPSHPLADLVRLMKVRIFYLREERLPAWDALLAIYPRHKPRVLAEMRYLIKRGQGLKAEELGRKGIDPLLLSALLPSVALTAEQWTPTWKLSEANAAAPWALNLQERLMLQATRLAAPGQLPPGFPLEGAAPTPLWGQLRLIALQRARALDAGDQAAAKLVPADYKDALVVARQHVLRGRFAAAAQVPKLAADLRQFLIKVVLDDAALAELAQAQDPVARSEAALVRAERLAAQGKWAEGAALVAAVGGKRAAVWKEAVPLAERGAGSGPEVKPADRLAWARWLVAHKGSLFDSWKAPWYRILTRRAAQLGKLPDAAKADALLDPRSEQVAIARHFTESSELYLALRAQVAHLATVPPTDRAAKGLLSDTDQTYNALVSDVTAGPFWTESLSRSELVASLRSLGKVIRAK